MGIDNPYPTYIDGLDASQPGATDPLSQADDHIRMIKTVLKQTFPNVSGAVTPTDASLNLLSGLQSIADAVYPVGCIYESTVATDPSTLFPGTTWSSFGQGKMLVGSDSGDTDFATGGLSSGSKTVALTTAQMPTHNHGHTLGTGNAGSHSHSVSGTAASAGSHSHGTNVRFSTHAALVGGQTTVTAGNGNVSTGVFPHNGTGTTGNNTTNHSGHTHSVSGSTNTVSAHNHSITGSISNAGNGDAHDNMPPYIVVYRWKRDS
jgi:microcystin-dependent protein